ncbi:DUF559 domain-containing protein [Singulisphaera acidiphila]|uniref:DUF559 domain-containing protein n=1 Tax=Singulisphaera acidiphila (strain ATCC BAA-1392 / DSM 18658 / VKM B-2454 / MOB10) TaxID=886293 RepID=L0DP64_SINAD|nr:DUF559 domain-containing protein [Singulisphaera acidiphila]AGA31047.1 hypothetical protein Sinac_6991 [Singulisphaera acidiphila DSM 18658]
MGAMNFLGHSGLLDRHQQRREAGLPTVSVLCGAVEIALQEVRRWAEQGGRPVIPLRNPDFEGILEAWVDHVSAGPDLVRNALVWLARHSGRSGSLEELASQVQRMTPFERTALFDSSLTDASTAGAGVACRWILDRWARGESIAGPGLTSRLGEVLAECDGTGGRERVVLALREMIPSANDPVLVLAREVEAAEPAAWIESAALSLARISLWQPSFATILVLDPVEFDGYVRNAPESRAKTLMRAGVIPVRGLGEDELPEATADLDGAVHRLVSDGASDELVHLFLDAARATTVVPSPPDAGGTDPARSAAERFLFERLQSLPATAGLFELNAVLDFRFGPSRAMEVDLWARSLGLAVEIDGYYHFQDADAYRRDRRKDVELQKRGYLVVRVLAEDVVARLEDVLSIILEAVASRGGRENHQQRGEAL